MSLKEELLGIVISDKAHVERVRRLTAYRKAALSLEQKIDEFDWAKLFRDAAHEGYAGIQIQFPRTARGVLWRTQNKLRESLDLPITISQFELVVFFARVSEQPPQVRDALGDILPDALYAKYANLVDLLSLPENAGMPVW